MRRAAQRRCFWGSAVGFLLMSAAIFMFYPASYLALNKGTDSLQMVSSILFWVGLLLGLGLQLVSWILRRLEQPNYKRQFMKKRTGMMKKHIVRNGIVGIMIGAFLIGAIGSAVSLMHSTSSSYHTFFFIALTAFGMCEYLAFNSLNFAYTMQRSEHYEK